ncbi:hypothetical protein GFL88_11895 [Rhizobium leguminosarum bv. viciae]|uniref:hypothetical protein n=1 Tax=Rhizobium leguminosarum TaxID=384 RepID=UPI001441FE58|nr:hypothetical protein [Rhizobium leguminosarum]NKK64224.1 hypothetical protein [Rhizobium leguminosarum bv. viciae]
MNRIIVQAALAFLALTSAKAESLPDIAQFAESICGEIPQGSLTKTSIQGKIEAQADTLAKIITGDANVSGFETTEIYKGIPFDKLPDNIPTVSMCKLEVVKLITDSRDNNLKPPLSITYTICSGEKQSICQAHDVHLSCHNNIQEWATARCGSFVLQQANTYGGDACGYSIDKLICSDPRNVSEFRNSYLRFELPAGWACKRDEMAYTCSRPYVQGQQVSAIIVTAARVAQKNEQLADTKRDLERRTEKLGPGSVVKAIADVQIGDTTWAEGTFIGSEIPNYQTRYVTTVKDGLAILYTFTAERSAYSELRGSERAVSTLQILSDWKK